MQRFARGVHIAVDDLRQMVVSGIAQPLPEWTEQTTQQFHLARGNAALMAVNYARAGFAVCVDDVFSARDFAADYASAFGDISVLRVLLLPKLEVALKRNAERTYKDLYPEVLIVVIQHLHAEYTVMDRRGWLVIDSSDLTVDEIVNKILERSEVFP